MKIHMLMLALLASTTIYAQPQQFDLVRFTQPAGWKKEASPNAIQFSKENSADGSYCLITVLKSIPGTKNAKENFDAAWQTVVMEMVKAGKTPEMLPASKENGWEALSGYAPFELEGANGLALLVTSTGYDRMVNIVILTNSNSFETEMTAFLESVSFSKPAVSKNTPPDAGSKTVTPVSQKSNTAPAKAINKGFAFQTTNFDDGWTSTVQEDWVEVTKGNLKVLIHYPKEGTIFPADPEPLTVAAWNILVAPRYGNLKNFRTAYITDYNRPYLGMGTLTENKTGNSVYVVLFRQGQTGWLEFVCPDKNSFISEYRFDPETIRWDSETSLMNALSRMVNYNKFAVAASDFTGVWTSDFTGVQQLYNVYTGNYAGMNINQSSETFQFGAGNTYSWKILAVNGMVGNMNFAQAKSSGKFNVVNSWQIRFSDIEGKPKTYHAHFSCIKGARILHLLDAAAPGSGIYTLYGKKQ